MSWPLDQGPLPKITTLTEYLFYQWEIKSVLLLFMHCFIQLSCSVAWNPCVGYHYDQVLIVNSKLLMGHNSLVLLIATCQYSIYGAMTVFHCFKQASSHFWPVHMASKSVPEDGWTFYNWSPWSKHPVYELTPLCTRIQNHWLIVVRLVAGSSASQQDEEGARRHHKRYAQESRTSLIRKDSPGWHCKRQDFFLL